MMGVRKTQVVIVGAGPVGMVLALLLRQADIEVILIDKRSEVTQLPRAIAVNQATLSLFERLCLGEVLQMGLKVPSVQLYWRNRELGRLEFKVDQTLFPYYFHIQQSKIEAILEQEVKKRNIEYHRQSELIKFSQEKNGVLATISSYGKELRLRSCYLVGADGGKSTARDLIHSSVLAKKYGAYFILSDVIFENQYLNESTHYYFTPEGYAMLVPVASGQTRLIFSFKGDVSESDLVHWNRTSLQALLSKRVKSAPQIEQVIWVTQGNFGHRLSKKSFEGRVVLAGDSLHQFSPVGGTNMNVGLQDARSLSVHLEALIKNKHVFKDSFQQYADERQLIIQNQQLITEWFTALMTRTKHYPKGVQYSLTEAQTHLIGAEKRSLEGNCKNKMTTNVKVTKGVLTC